MATTAETRSTAFGRADAPTAVRLVLKIFKVASEPVQLDPSSGYVVQFRFEPNDIGKVDFRAEALQVVNGDLVLNRHGRTLRRSLPSPSRQRPARRSPRASSRCFS